MASHPDPPGSLHNAASAACLDSTTSSLQRKMKSSRIKSIFGLRINRGGEPTNSSRFNNFHIVGEAENQASQLFPKG